MTTEVYQVSLEDMVNGTDPAELGYKPLFKVKPGEMSETALVRIKQNSKESLLTLYCEKDNSETKIYKVDPKAYLTAYGRTGKRRLLIQDSEHKPFAFIHDMTIFPGIPVYMEVEDEAKKRGWLKLVHR